MLLLNAIQKEVTREAVYFSLQGLYEILKKDSKNARDRIKNAGGLDVLKKVKLYPVLEI